MKAFVLMLAVLSFASTTIFGQSATAWNYKQELLPVLVQEVPRVLRTENETSGRFGSGIWVSSDQAVIFQLAAAWAYKDEKNPHYHDPKLLEAVMRCGDVLAETMDASGRWMFRKKDNSTWGMYFNPWVYSRWIRANSLIRDDMPPERRARWEKALNLGFTGIAKHELSSIHNIPAHQAMGLFFAGKSMDRAAWCEQAGAFLLRVAAAQDKNGFWSEHVGPVVGYNAVYVDALGTYYAVSRDARVLDALQRAARFHANFTYPDGTNIETIDERNPYSKRSRLPNVGLTFTPEGRGYLRQQWSRLTEGEKKDSADVIASLLLYGEEGPVAPSPGQDGKSTFIMEDGKASVVRSGPWCAALSAYTCPLYKNRWIQDRQNFVSLFHEATGLIVGGGNTKLQPLWSTFTLGDTKLLQHRAGDQAPNFAPKPGLIHLPSKADLKKDGRMLSLRYADVWCNVDVDLSQKDARLIYTTEPSTNSVEAHVTLLPALGTSWRTAAGKEGRLGAETFQLPAAEAGDWFEHNGWRINLPKHSTLSWPALPHNPYRKDGRAEPAEGRIVLTLPFTTNVLRHEITVTILPKSSGK